MDYLNYMMNPDNILENLNQAQTAGGPPPRSGCPMMNSGFPMPPHCPRFGTDKAQEAKEKTTEVSSAASAPPAAEQETRSGFESLYENLVRESHIPNAVPLGTDANVMTTSIGVAAKEVEIEKGPKETSPEKSHEDVTKPVEVSLREKLQEKLDEMERELENDKKNRSSSPTISYTSEDSDEMNGRDRDWTVLDNDEAEAGQNVQEPTRDTGAIAKETKLVEDKSTLTENSSGTSSMFASANGNGDEKEAAKKDKKTTENPRGKPLTFEEMGKQLKAHIDEYRNLAVPVGPPADPSGLQAPITPGVYPHLPTQATPTSVPNNNRRVFHPSK